MAAGKIPAEPSHTSRNALLTVAAAKLYFLRHGQTDANLENRLMGSQDEPLNSNGIAQARQVARQLACCKLNHIYTSPLRRALQTAEVIADAQSKPCAIVMVNDLRERAYGNLEGCLKGPDLENRIETVTSVEPWQAFVARTTNAMKGIARHPGTKLIVSHSGVFKVLRASGAYTSLPERDSLDNAEWVQLIAKRSQ